MTKFFRILVVLCTIASIPSMAQNLVDNGHLKQTIIKNAKALGFTANDLQNYRIANAYYDETSNLTYAYLQQTVKGVDVYNAIATVAFRDDKLMSIQSSWITVNEEQSKKLSAKTGVTPVTALQRAAAELNLPLKSSFFTALSQTADGQEFEYENFGVSLNNIIVRLMWVNDEITNKLRLGWQVSLTSNKDNGAWLVKVDALTGQVFNKTNLTAYEDMTGANKLHNMYAYEVNSFEEPTPAAANAGPLDLQAVTSAKYNVIPYPKSDPNFTSPVLVTNPWTINGDPKAYTKKWNSDAVKDYDSLKGNNVQVYEDINHDNKPGASPKSSTLLPDLTWNFTPDYTVDPIEEPTTENFGLTNLFYLNNLMHDMSYNYSFNEAAGNMQTSNLSRGGKQNDFVFAEGFDGGDTSNADFAPAVDGQKSRMQMYLWRPSTLKLLKFNSPNDLLGPMQAQESNLSTNNKLSQTGVITQNVVYYNDAAQAGAHKACGIASNNAALAGKIAYIDRGGCTFVIKLKNAQTAGAKGVIVGDSLVTGSKLVIMSGSDNTITIPGLFVVYSDAQRIKNDLNQSLTVNATMSPAPRIDGNLDNGIPAHEYGHGISNRLTGGPGTVSCLNNGEQMGEGWSDYFALMMTTDWNTATLADSSAPRPIGNYALGLTPSYGGIRVHPYSKLFSIDPWTYDVLKTDTSIHEYNATSNPGAVYYTGELWCSTLWDLTWDLCKAEGINKTFFNATKAGGNTTAMKLVMQGMKLQKCSPGCLDGRDAILKADTALYGASHSAIIWKAFARRGMGYSAKQGLNTKIKDGTAAYNLPPGVSLQPENNTEAQAAVTKAVVRVSPNPASNNVNVFIPGNTKQLTVRLMNNNGALLGTYSLSGESLNMDVSKYSAGVYNILVTGENTDIKYRLVIQ